MLTVVDCSHAICRLLLEGNLDAAESALSGMDKQFQSLWSPALCAKQQLQWGCYYYTRVTTLTMTGQPTAGFYAKALMAYEQARAHHPACWREASTGMYGVELAAFP